jgi:phosphate transport system permease protein
VEIPDGFFSSATVLPVQIYLWASSAEQGFVELASAGIMILLSFMITMNALAIWLRKRLERRW